MRDPMTSLARPHLRAHRRVFAGVFVAVLTATMLITGLGVLVESGARGGIAPQRYASVDAVVTARTSLPVVEEFDLALPERRPLAARQLKAIRALPEVADAVGDLTVPLVVGGAEAQAHGWSSATIAGTRLLRGRAPRAADEVVVDRRSNARVGDTIDLTTAGGVVRAKVVGTLDTRGARQPELYLTDDRAAELAPHAGRSAAVLVTAAKGRSVDQLTAAIRAELPGVQVHTGRARGDAEFADAGGARAQLAELGVAFAGLALMVSLFVVAATLALAVGQRRREFALLRAVGASPWQVRRMVGHEVLLVAGLAAAVGVLPGYAVAAGLGRAFVGAGLLPGDFALAWSPLPAVAAVVLALTTARVAAWAAVRRPAKTDPVEALAESHTGGPRTLGRGRVIWGLSLLVLGLGAASTPLFVSGPVAVESAASATLVLMIAFALLGPALIAKVMDLLAGPMVVTGRPSMVLASASGRHGARRLASAITPLALAIGLGCVQVFAGSTVAAEAGNQAEVGMLADTVVGSAGPGLDADAVARIAATPGVRAASAVTRSTGFVVSGSGELRQTLPMPLQGVDPAGVGKTLDLGVVSGDLTRLRGPATVALSTDAAATLGGRIGRRIELTLGDGTRLRPVVVATYSRGLGFGDLTLDNAVVRAHTTTGLSSEVLLRTDPAQRAEVTTALTTAGFAVASAQALRAAGEQERDAQSWTSLIALVILLGYLGVAVVNTLVLATLDRGREFALVRLVGARAAQVRAQMRIESLLVVLIALLVGTAIAVPPLVGVAFGITGSPLPAIDLTTYAVLVVTTVTVGMLSIAIPTRCALRAAPIAATGTRE